MPGSSGIHRKGKNWASKPVRAKAHGAAVSSKVPAQEEGRAAARAPSPRSPSDWRVRSSSPEGTEGYLALGFCIEGGAMRNFPNQNTGRMFNVWEQLSTFP